MSCLLPISMACSLHQLSQCLTFLNRENGRGEEGRRCIRRRPKTRKWGSKWRSTSSRLYVLEVVEEKEEEKCDEENGEKANGLSPKHCRRRQHRRCSQCRCHRCRGDCRGCVRALFAGPRTSVLHFLCEGDVVLRVFRCRSPL